MEVDERTLSYIRDTRNLAARAYQQAHADWTAYEPEGAKYALSIYADVMRTIEVPYLIIYEFLAPSEAEAEANRRCPGRDPDAQISHANKTIGYESHRLSRAAGKDMDAETLCRMYSRHRGWHPPITPDGLLEILDRDADDPDRQDLLAWAPLSPDEIREILHRRYPDEGDVLPF